MRDRGTALILLVVGFILIVAGFQGKLGAVFAALLSPGDVVLDAGTSAAPDGTFTPDPNVPDGGGGGRSTY